MLSGAGGCHGKFWREVPGQEFVDAVDRMFSDAGQHVAKIRFGVETVEFGVVSYYFKFLARITPHVWEFDDAAVTVTVVDVTLQLPAIAIDPCTDVKQIGVPV